MFHNERLILSRWASISLILKVRRKTAWNFWWLEHFNLISPCSKLMQQHALNFFENQSRRTPTQTKALLIHTTVWPAFLKRCKWRLLEKSNGCSISISRGPCSKLSPFPGKSRPSNLFDKLTQRRTLNTNKSIAHPSNKTNQNEPHRKVDSQRFCQHWRLLENHWGLVVALVPGPLRAEVPEGILGLLLVRLLLRSKIGQPVFGLFCGCARSFSAWFFEVQKPWVKVSILFPNDIMHLVRCGVAVTSSFLLPFGFGPLLEGELCAWQCRIQTCKHGLWPSFSEPFHMLCFGPCPLPGKSACAAGALKVAPEVGTPVAPSNR